MKVYFYISCALNVLVILISLIILRFLPPEVPIFYGFPQGEMQLTKTIGILLIPSLSLIFTGFNMFLSGIVKNDYIKKVLVFGGLTITIFSLITTVKIIFLVI